MYATLVKDILAGELARQGQKKIDEDANTTGADDAQGREFKALAAGINAIDFNVPNPKSLNRIGDVLIAAGTQLKTESANLANQS